MPINEEYLPVLEGKMPVDISGNYQPIHLEDTVGAIFLGILSIILLIGWRRAEKRYHRLLLQQAGLAEKDSSAS